MGYPADEPEQESSVSRSAEERCVLRNHLLLSIPVNELRLLRPHLQPCHFRQHEILHEPSQRLQFAYFPNSGLISLVVAMADGSTVEAGMVGREDQRCRRDDPGRVDRGALR